MTSNPDYSRLFGKGMKRVALVLALGGLSGGLGAGCGGSNTGEVGSGTAAAATGGGNATITPLLGPSGGKSNASGGASNLPGNLMPSPTGNTFVPGDPNAPCVPGTTHCTDCIDNDGDGLVDWMDPECTGPLDNDEKSYATGIPGDNVDFCQDCFFDGNSGHGDDGCQYHTVCLTGGTPTKGGGGCFSCDVTDTCVKNCAQFTPNGCDCFGCCSVPGTDRAVLLSANCDAKSANDPEKCTPCTPSTQCNNDCTDCELCFGKETLPESCYQSSPPPASGGGGNTGGAPSTPTVPPQVCADGVQPCDTNLPCPTGYYCLTGCCTPPAIIR